MERRNPYMVLGVRENATDEEIKDRYRQLTLIHHPDRNPGDPRAGVRMREINAAHDELRSPERRAALDRELRRARRPAPTDLEKIGRFIAKARDWLRHDPLGRIVATGIQNAIDSRRAKDRPAPPAPTPSAGPSPSPPSPAPAAIKKAAPKKRASKRVTAKKSAPKKSKRRSP